MITQPIIVQIEEAVKDIPGWTPLDQLYSLYVLVCTSTELQGDIVELGSWCGRSAVVLGMATRQLKKGMVYCIDLFPGKNDWYKNADGSYSFSVDVGGKKLSAYTETSVWAEPYLRDIVPVYDKYDNTLDAFNQSIKSNNLVDWVTPAKGDLELFAASLPETFALKFAFIDGDHGYDAVKKDIGIIERYLVPGGWLCFDDAFTSYQGVNDAIKELIIESGEYMYYQQMTRKLFIAKRRL